jgi:CBS domain containing-hemolysin-like protein
METSWSTTLTGLAAVVILVALNAFFVAAEFALVGSRKTKLEEMIRLAISGRHWRNASKHR